MDCQESFLKLSGGQTIALKIWRNSSSTNPARIPVLALHGWLDNAATFDVLAPLLGTTVYAVDLPGHGLSSHRAEGAEYYIWSYVEDVIAIAEALELNTFALVGHSMGGAIACLVSSLYPQRVQTLVLLDSLGPLATDAQDAPVQMKKALRQKCSVKKPSQHFYSSWEDAAAARARNGLQDESARLLAKRGVAQLEQGYYWNNDRRLSRKNLLSMNEEQIAAFLRGISIPTLLIAAEHLLNIKQQVFELRLGYIPNLTMVKLDGRHHQHLEENVDQVAKLINDFFKVLLE